jgi:phage terminase large subunit-like protein
MVPRDDGISYPTLGEQVVEWMHENLVFGPGDLRGEPLQLDAEQQAFIWRFYEHYPKGHPLDGRRRFRRCALSLAKGLRKTELSACIAAAELHPDAPVRFNGWDGKGLATGRGVKDPFVVLVAYTEEQSDELAYGALRAILELSPIRDDFDIGLERIERAGGGGKAVSLSGSPSARDGARTTWQLFDETHWHTLPRQRQAHQTMIQNTAKRPIADPWSLETTTAPEPGAGSVAEKTMEYAEAVKAGKVTDATLFFFHRQAGDEHDLTTKEGARAAVIEASGPAAVWRDIEGIVSMWNDPTIDRSYWERVWCNRLVKSASQAFDVERWKTLARADNPVKTSGLITLGFDGAMFFDSTAIVATDVETGYQWLAGIWERPLGLEQWQVPAGEVDALVRDLFHRFTVCRLYADPFKWQSWLSAWAGEFDAGRAAHEKRVIEWRTNRPMQMAAAVENFDTAIKEGRISHDGDPQLLRHVGNARRHELSQRDGEGQPLWVIRKDRPDSPHKIDAAMAAVLSWEARTDAIAAGALRPDPTYDLMIMGGR